MTVAQMIEELKKLPPDAKAVWYDSEYSSYSEVNAISLVEIGVREVYSSATDELVGKAWEHFSVNDDRQTEKFTAVEVNTYLEQH